jgi:DNA-binding CsgD family transcriptional regulator
MFGGQRPSEGTSCIEQVQIEQLFKSMRLRRDLSSRERDVAVAGARGLDTKSTAVELGLSPKTVDEIWRRLYRKFGCKSRVEVLSRLLAVALNQAEGTRALPRL